MGVAESTRWQRGLAARRRTIDASAVRLVHIVELRSAGEGASASGSVLKGTKPEEGRSRVHHGNVGRRDPNLRRTDSGGGPTLREHARVYQHVTRADGSGEHLRVPADLWAPFARRMERRAASDRGAPGQTAERSDGARGNPRRTEREKQAHTLLPAPVAKLRKGGKPQERRLDGAPRARRKPFAR